MLKTVVQVALLLLVAVTEASAWTYKRVTQSSIGKFKQFTRKYDRKIVELKGDKIPVKGKYGFIQVSDKGDDYFYMLYAPKNPQPDSPLLIWLSGGPGCASTMAMLYENGPIQITKEGVVQENPWSWNDKAHLLFIDQPVGTGFGHFNLDSIPQTEEAVRSYFLQFMLNFYKVHPEFASKNLYISGESYAGHYIPAIAEKLFYYNSNQFRLKGVAIGNGWTSPQHQEVSYADFSSDNGLINATLRDQLVPLFRICQNLYRDDPALFQARAPSFCGAPFDRIVLDDQGNARFSYYNYKEPCDVPGCIPLDNEFAYLDAPEVLNEFGVSSAYVDCSDPVYYSMTRIDERTDAAVYLRQPLEDGLKVLAYHGDLDLICNYIGGLHWTGNLTWSGQAAYVAAPMVEFSKPKQGGGKLVVGTLKQAGEQANLKFVRVFEAGHLVPHDQPEASLFLINYFLGYEQPAP